MVDVCAPTRPGPWTPRVILALAVLAAAAFVYVTAEIMPIGALPAIAADLDTSEASVGRLLAGYALVAAVATVPLVRWTAAWPRRTTLLFTLLSLVISQLISALAPTFTVLALGRGLCALTHGLMWAVIAPIGVRLVPPAYAGRATTAVFAGTGLALVVGSPLTAMMSQVWGWREAVAAITAAALAVAVAARFALPLMSVATPAARWPGRRRHSRGLSTLSLLTFVGVTAHFISYTFIVVIIRDIVGIGGVNLAWLLAAYGVSGLTAMGLLARLGDRRPRAAILGSLAGLCLALTVLARLGVGGSHSTAALLIGVVAVVVWGATATAMAPLLQSAAMRHSPDDPDGASALYVAAFQVGIMTGSVLGGTLFEFAGLTVMLATSALLIAVIAACVAAGRDLLVGTPGGV
ncbi:MAG: MFS transporter [Mycobacterium sp.]|nr:MFS transporter [Mycobacterium sp.]